MRSYFRTFSSKLVVAFAFWSICLLISLLLFSFSSGGFSFIHSISIASTLFKTCYKTSERTIRILPDFTKKKGSILVGSAEIQKKRGSSDNHSWDYLIIECLTQANNIKTLCMQSIMILSMTMELLSVYTVIRLKPRQPTWIRVKRTRTNQSESKVWNPNSDVYSSTSNQVLMMSVPVPFSVNSYFVSVYGLYQGYTSYRS